MKNYITIKKQAYYTALLLVISFAFYFTAQAQQPLECPEPKVSKEKLQRMLQYRKNAASSKITSATIQVRVFAHIVSNNDGTLAGATPEDIN